MPIAEPARISIAKCCDRYTREYPTSEAITKNSTFSHLFFTISANPKNNANAVIVCPEGKLCALYSLTPSTRGKLISEKFS